jgi:oligoribonuclease NrnB/cAMP/cGMP phosphodiesterase (DHH superfamily)
MEHIQNPPNTEPKPKPKPNDESNDESNDEPNDESNTESNNEFGYREILDDLTFDHLLLKREDIDLVIYHGGCNDGMGSCLSVFLYLSSKFPNRLVQYIPESNFDAAPPDVTGKNVLICDFSYKKPILEKMIKIANKLAVLDHHKSALIELTDIPDEYKVFRMNYSGAYLTWRFCHPNRRVPLMIQYIQDSDIWTKIMEHTDEFFAFLCSTNQTFDDYEKLMDENYLMSVVTTIGSGILYQNNYNIEKFVKYGAPKLITIKGVHYFAVYLNSNVLKSEVGNKILYEYPNANFSAIYNFNDYDKSTSFSLRSMDDRTDVSQIGKLFNGGGHRNASGIRIYGLMTELPTAVNDSCSLYESLNNIYYNTITDEEFNGINIVYLNLQSHKKVMGKYLLQTRYSENNVPIQECVSIFRKRGQSIDQCSISAIWNYDGNLNRTLFTIQFHSNLSSEMKTALINKFKQNIVFEDVTFITAYRGRNKENIPHSNPNCLVVAYNGFKITL